MFVCSYSNKETWIRRRKLLNATFHRQTLESYIPIMTKQCDKLVDGIRMEIKNTGKNDFTDITHRISDRVMAMLLQTVIDCDENDIDPKFAPYQEKVDELMGGRLAEPWKLLPIIYGLTSEGSKFFRYIEFNREQARILIQKRSKKLATDKSDKKLSRPALIDALITDHQQNPNLTTIEDITDEVFTFLGAGWDTTTWTGSFTLMMIGLYPEVQEKVYQEISNAFSDNSDLTMSDIMNLKYLECVINESMRLFPLASFHGRRICQDIDVEIDDKSITIPSGTDIVLDSELLHRNPRYWNDPDRFDPDRFLPENSKGRDPYCFIPFSAGPRNCIGKTFGMMEDKLIIGKILKSFHVTSLDPLDKIEMDCRGMARRTYKPLRFKITPRK